ncbi:MAG: hypothetical protein JNL62_09050 [Bryobacterales bacterium]|nr:hypothetical protein [Bryobacterales bacterium]
MPEVALRFSGRPSYYHYMPEAFARIPISRRVFCLSLTTLASAATGDRGRVEYIGGTVDAFPGGTDGILKTSDKEYLILVTKRATMKVLYERVNLLEYGQQVSRRYAMAILISPVLILSRKRKHFLTVGFQDDAGKQQAAVFTVDKNDIRTLLASLEARTGVRVEFQDEEARRQGRG